MNVRVLSVAEVEAADAASYYDDRQDGLGAEFLIEFEHALDRIRREPRLLGKVEDYAGPHELRRCLLHRFPFVIFFQLQFDEAIIVAVADGRRRPFYWLDRIN